MFFSDAWEPGRIRGLTRHSEVNARYLCAVMVCQKFGLEVPGSGNKFGGTEVTLDLNQLRRLLLEFLGSVQRCVLSRI